MEKQRVSVFKQNNRWGLTALSAVFCLLLTPVMGTAVFMPQLLAFIPVLALLLLAYVGPVSASICMGLMIGSNALFYGIWGAVMGAVLVIPVVVASVMTTEHDHPFWHCVAAGGVTMFASMGAVVAMISLLAGSDVVTAITQMVRQGFEVSGALGDTLLNMMLQMGQLAAPEGVDLSGGIAALDAKTKESMISSLLMVTDAVLRLELPMQMATGSVAAGLLGQAALRKGMIHRGIQVEYPQLSTWRVPKGWGRILGGTLAVLYLLAMLVPQSMNTMFYVFSGVFNKVFALQGIAAICYKIRENRKPVFWQRVVFVLGYFFLGEVAVIFGIADQAMDFTHRREKLDELENPFDPRHGA